MEKLRSARSWLSFARVIRQRQSALRSISTLTVIAALLSMCVPMAAQVRFGGVVGSVTDVTGASVPDATVILMNLGTNEKRTSTTGQNGNYTFPNVNAGLYRLEIEKTGFKKFIRAPLEVQVDVTSRADAALEVGAVSQTVEVTTEAPILQTDSSSLGQVVEQNQIAATPIAGRNTNNLLALVPGVVPGGTTYGNMVGNQAGGARTNSIAFGNYAIGGGFGNQSSFIVDGVNGNGPANNANSLVPSQDAVQEFRVATNNVSAEYGNYAGGVVNITTKSGTNNFHGSIYDYLRNQHLNANDYFSKLRNLSRAPLTQNQFGARLGGPIQHNKTFFFFNYEGLRFHSGVNSPSTTTVPTLAMLNGDFSQAGLPRIFDPTTGAQFQCNGVLNVICPNRIDPSAQKILKDLYPTGSPTVATITPPSTFGVNNYIYRTPIGGVQDQYLGRVDHSFGSKDNMFGRYTYWKVLSNPFDAWGTHTQGQGKTGIYSQQSVLGNTYSISDKTMLDVRASYVRIFQNESPDTSGIDLSPYGGAWSSYPPSLLGTHMKPAVSFATTSGAGAPALASAAITGANGQGSQLYWHQNVYALTASVTKIVNNHTIKFGGTLRRIQWITEDLNQNIALAFDPLYSALNNTQGNGTGFALASALLGVPASTQVVNFGGMHAFYHQYGFFVEDTYQVSRKLTANLGLRWDQPGIYSDASDSDTVFLPNAAAPVTANGKTISSYVNPATGQTQQLMGLMTLVNSQAWPSRREDNLHWKLFAPRVGLAYRLTDKTVVRGGYGLSFLPPTLSQDGPLASAVNGITTPVTNTFGSSGNTIRATVSNPFPSGIALPPRRNANFVNYIGTRIASRVPGDAQPYAQQWNLAVERQVGANGALTLAYAGSKGTHLLTQGAFTFANLNINQVPDKYLALGPAVLNALVPNPFFGIVTDPSNILSAPTIRTEQLLKPFPQYDRVQAVDPHLGYSSYNALQTSFRERFGLGFVTVAYTWSKLMSNTDSVTSFLDESSIGGASPIQDNTAIGQDRSISNYDVPHNLTFGYSLELPFGKNKRFLDVASGAVDKIVSGWRFNGLTSIRSGTPIAVTQTGSQLQGLMGVATGFVGATSSTIRPDIVPGCNTSVSGSSITRLNQWFNTSCFTAVPAGPTDTVRFGTASRVISSIRTMGTNNWDLSLTKDTPVTERVNVQFTAQAFNLFNHSRFGAPVTNRSAANFGQVTSVVNLPRQIEFGLRFSF
jgi:outer membrane receptor protein involved in Fe transport